MLLVNPHRLVTTPLCGFGNEPLHREVRLAGRGAGVLGRHFPHKWRHTYATELSFHRLLETEVRVERILDLIELDQEVDVAVLIVEPVGQC